MKAIFSDFDGTLTIDGKIGAVFFDILDLAQKNNTEFIVVSGRSLSWGHFLLTHTSVRYCIMEGGGVIVYRDEKGEIKEENLVSDETILKLEEITKSLVRDIPTTQMSADSFGRRTDRAIEIFHMQDSDAKQVEDYLKKHNVNFSKSDVHLNFWLEDLSKANGVKQLIQNYLPSIDIDECLFFGDAPNDQSMFKLFKHSVGVSNIKKMIDQIKHPPTVILKGPENSGALGVINYLNQHFNE